MEHVLVMTCVVGLVFLVATGTAVAVVVRRIRRRYRSARARLQSVWGPRPDARSVLQVSGSAALATVGSPAWWGVQRRRHELWRSVTSAEQAVRVATQAGVTVGDLPALATRLRAAAGGVDALLRAGGGRGELRDEDRRDCDQIVAAAHDLRSAALSSLRSDSQADARTVAEAVHIEVAALAAGIRAAHG